LEKKRRFVSTTDEEIEQKGLKMNAQKTIKQNIAAATLLREYLKEKHLLFLGMEFFHWPVKRINLIL
jgi:nucleoside diphosphate kinase